MKVLVFGATGQVGNALRAYDGVVALARSDADLTEPEACAARIMDTDADTIINAAAYTAVDKAETDAEAAFVINAKAPIRMAEAAAARGLPFLTISTDYVFGGEGTAPYEPSAPTRPINVYGQSKLAGEDGVRAAGGRHVILRTSWVFSAHGNNFVKTMLRLGKTRPHLSVVDDQIGGPTAATDIAACLMQMAGQLRDGAQGGTYHFSGAPDVSWAGFAQEIFRQAGRDVSVTPIPTSDYPTPAQRPLNSCLDCRSLFDDFAIARPDWRISLARVLQQLGRD